MLILNVSLYIECWGHNNVDSLCVEFWGHDNVDSSHVECCGHANVDINCFRLSLTTSTLNPQKTGEVIQTLFLS